MADDGDDEQQQQQHTRRRQQQQQQHPFDPRVSHKEPFPSFDTAMASTAAGDDDDGSDAEVSANLDWSIDTIAELKPAAFSPLPEQKAATTSGDASEFTPTTAAKRAQFFEDEAQYKVLQTPSPLVRQEQQQRQRPPSPPSASATRRISRLLPGVSTSSDLHSRCQDAIAFFGDRVRERQRKLSRLQLPHPTPLRTKSASKRHRRANGGEFPWKTPELKSGIHPRTSESRSHRPGSAPGSLLRSTPGGRQTPVTPVRSSSAAHKQRAEPEFSFGECSPISPIASAAPGSASAPRQAQQHSAASDDKNVFLSPIIRGAGTTPAFESPSLFSSDDDRDKENSHKRQHQQQQQHPPSASFRSSVAGDVDSRAASPSFTLSSPSSWGKAAESSLSIQTLAMLQQQGATTGASAPQLPSPSIAQRQQSFVAAIEAASSSPAASSEVPH